MTSRKDRTRRDAVHQMVSDDARWFASIVMSNPDRKDEKMFGVIWTLLHHACRIQYEGYDVINSKDPLFARKDLALHWDTSHWAPVENMRHFSKVMDKKRNPLPDVLKSIRNTQASLTSSFLDTYPRGQGWKRWLTGDISIMMMDGQLLGTSTMAMERYGVTWSRGDARSGEIFRSASESWGRNIGILCRVDGRPFDSQSAKLSLPIIKELDRHTDRYFASHYTSNISIPEALLLSLIEGDLNASRLIISQGGAEHREARFRAQYLTLFHSAQALKGLISMESSSVDRQFPELREVMRSGGASILLEDSGRRLRNRCFHYKIDDPEIRLDPNAPLFGILDHAGVGLDFNEMEALVQRVTTDLVNVLAKNRYG